MRLGAMFLLLAAFAGGEETDLGPLLVKLHGSDQEARSAADHLASLGPKASRGRSAPGAPSPAQP